MIEFKYDDTFMVDGVQYRVRVWTDEGLVRGRVFDSAGEFSGYEIEADEVAVEIGSFLDPTSDEYGKIAEYLKGYVSEDAIGKYNEFLKRWRREEGGE